MYEQELLTAVRHGWFSDIQYCISNGTDIRATDYVGRNILHLAAIRGDLELMEFLVRHTDDIVLNMSKEFDFILLLAISSSKGRTQTLPLTWGLLNALDSYGQYPISYAMQYQHTHTAHFLSNKATSLMDTYLSKTSSHSRRPLSSHSAKIVYPQYTPYLQTPKKGKTSEKTSLDQQNTLKGSGSPSFQLRSKI